jgi:hypothetical protein
MTRRLYLCRDPDASIRHAARFCSLGPLSAAGPIALPAIVERRASRASPSPTSIASRTHAVTEPQGEP